MRAKTIVLFLASAGLLLSLGAAASAQSKQSKGAAAASMSEAQSGDWRERAMRARAEAPDDAAPPRGRVRNPEGRTDGSGREESVGAGDLGKDRGEGGKDD